MTPSSFAALLHSSGALERLDQQAPLDLVQDRVEIAAVLRQRQKARGGGARLPRELSRQVAEAYHARDAERDRAFDHVLELANVAGISVLLDGARRVGGEAEHVLAHLSGKAPQEALGEERDVLAPLAERREIEPDHVQAVVQILTELAALDFAFHVAVGRGEHADVDRKLLSATDRAHAALLKHAEEFHLERVRELAHLVEQQGAAVRVAK